MISTPVTLMTTDEPTDPTENAVRSLSLKLHLRCVVPKSQIAFQIRSDVFSLLVHTLYGARSLHALEITRRRSSIDLSLGPLRHAIPLRIIPSLEIQSLNLKDYLAILLRPCRREPVEACTHLVVMARNRAIHTLIASWYSWSSTLFYLPALFVE